jgi:hypothetical protein
MAKPPKAAKPGRMLWLQGLACGALVTMATPTALLAFVLLAPTLLVWFLDTAPGKPTLRPVAMLGLGTSAYPMLELWRLGHTMSAAIDLALDPSVLVLAWAAQSGGWLLVELLPLVISVGMQIAATARAARLQALRRRYEEEWDFPPRDAGPPTG